MKKDYLKPETVEVDLLMENYILNDSSNRMPITGEEGDSDTGKHRGEWGNVWGK